MLRVRQINAKQLLNKLEWRHFVTLVWQFLTGEHESLVFGQMRVVCNTIVDEGSILASN
jgi:hypothetical protein